jgi:hypothetical protein
MSIWSVHGISMSLAYRGVVVMLVLLFSNHVSEIYR